MKIAEQATDDVPLQWSPHFDIPLLIDADDRIRLHSSRLEIRIVEFAIVQDLCQRSSSHFNEFHTPTLLACLLILDSNPNGMMKMKLSSHSLIQEQSEVFSDFHWQIPS